MKFRKYINILIEGDERLRDPDSELTIKRDFQAKFKKLQLFADDLDDPALLKIVNDLSLPLSKLNLIS